MYQATDVRFLVAMQTSDGQLLAQAVRTARESKKLTQTQLGDLVGLQRRMVTNIEGGSGTTMARRAKLSEVLGVNLDPEHLFDEHLLGRVVAAIRAKAEELNEPDAITYLGHMLREAQEWKPARRRGVVAKESLALPLEQPPPDPPDNTGR